LYTSTKRITDLNQNAENIISTDSRGNELNGGKTYKLKLQAEIPASEFWSVIVYDNQTRLMIRTDQSWPSVFSSSKRLLINQDGSVDVWFGPNAPTGKENNWIQTVRGKGWNTILRLYDPLESWFNGTWKPGEIEEMK
jgi:hypothetical protein